MRHQLRQRLAVLAQVGVVAQQVGQARLGRGLHLDARRLAHAIDQLLRQRDAADARALAFGEHGAVEVEALQLLREQRLEMLLRGLRHTAQRAQQRAAVPRQAFQVEHLRAALGHAMQQPRLGAAGGAAQHHQRQGRAGVGDAFDDVAAPALVAPRELLRVPADQAQPVHHRAAAQAAAPAVDQRLPVRRLVREALAQVARQVGRHHRAAHAPGLEGAGLLVDRADDAALVVVEHRAVDGAGDVVERELRRRAGVDQGVEGPDVGDADRLAVAHRGAGKRAARAASDGSTQPTSCAQPGTTVTWRACAGARSARS